MAIREWAKLMDGELVSLERALAAFDMFILENQEWDFNNVCASSRVVDEACLLGDLGICAP